RHLMENIGKKLVKLDPFSALVVLLAVGITIHIYSIIGVPVSSSQAIIGGVLGVGIIRGVNTIKIKMLFNILIGWFLTPFVACFFALAIEFIVHLHYIPHQ
ncbi:MAG: inorganic phosphate transporter, partial [Desulfobacterium sp.]|nr:inorganic phosphate transporter [Desulfobacterium sp.]MBU4035471.1 inorganic phosphate transporter [Pseudomonadota bacterium]